MWLVSDIPEPDLDEESCQMILKRKAAIPVPTPDDCLEAKFSMEEFGQITRRFFEYNNKEARNIGDKIEDVIPDKPILCYVESAEYTCGFFDRQKFENGLFDGSKEFHEFRYWMDENDVPKRLKQMQDQSNAAATQWALPCTREKSADLTLTEERESC